MPRQTGSGASTSIIVAAIALHALLGWTIGDHISVGLAQVGIASVVAIACALQASPAVIVASVAYIAASEVLWRAAKLPVPWEAAKYLVVLVLGTSMLRHRPSFRALAPAAAYFLLLLPSTLLVLADASASAEGARQIITVGLLAPLAVALCVAFGVSVSLSEDDLRKIAVAAVVPLVSLAVFTASRTYGRSDITFTGESNFATSGGFGPSQVSTVLGFGVLIAFFAALDSRTRRTARVLFICCSIFLAVQSAMTFSRGGLYNVAGALLLVAPALLKRKESRRTMVVVLFMVSLGITALVVQANQFTSGALLGRFQQTQTTGRTELIANDLSLFWEHPWFGIGPGATRTHRQGLTGNLEVASAHAEFSRMLSEHGILGLLSLLILISILGLRILKARGQRDRSIVIAMVSWAALAQANSALRTIAPAIALCLAATRHSRDESYTVAEASREPFGSV